MRITTVIYLIKTESLQFQMKQSVKKMTNIYIYIYIYIYILWYLPLIYMVFTTEGF